MTRHFCDICDKQLDGGTSYRLIYRFVEHNDISSEYQSASRGVDLCPHCFSIFEQTYDSEKGGDNDDAKGNT